MKDNPGDTNNQLYLLAKEVLKSYDIDVSDIEVIQGGSIKTVWKIKSDKGMFCLKRLKQTYEKALFSVNAQKYIKDSKGRVPDIFPDKSSELIVVYNDQIFVLYEWLKGRDLNFSAPSDLREAVKGLAAFHIASKGYKPVEEARVSTKLERWTEQYNSMRKKFIAWKETANANNSAPYHASYLKSADKIVDLANKAITYLENSRYRELGAENSGSIVLCHQDYGRGNALFCPDGVYVIDLDGVTFDLPARDLRKIIGKQAEVRGTWDRKMIDEIIGWYSEVNPLSKDEKEILYIDLLFPHWFFGLVKNLYKNNKTVKSSEIERIAKLESQKVPILQSLIDGGE